MLGALAVHTGGLTIDHNWLRVLGGPALLEWQAALDDGLVVGHDAAGGFFAVGTKDGEVRYLVPGGYEWMETEMGHAAWVHWTLMGDVEGFYADMREPGWEAQSAALTPRPGAGGEGAGEDGRDVGSAAQPGPPAGGPLMRRRLPLAIFFLGAGIMHFVKPGAYEATVPDALPSHREIVYVSGVAEIAGALALLDRRSAPWAGWWLIALLVAVFPANVNMAVNAERFRAVPEALLWIRLPIQVLLIAWVWRVSSPLRSRSAGPA